MVTGRVVELVGRSGEVGFISVFALMDRVSVYALADVFADPRKCDLKIEGAVEGVQVSVIDRVEALREVQRLSLLWPDAVSPQLQSQLTDILAEISNVGVMQMSVVSVELV